MLGEIPQSPHCPLPLAFHFPTPAARLQGRTLLSTGGPCPSVASWSASPWLASAPSDKAGRGVSGFGSFCRNKRASPAGATPGNTEHHGDTRVGDISAMRSTASAVSTGTTQDGFPIQIVKLSGQNHILPMMPFLQSLNNQRTNHPRIHILFN